MVGNLAVWPACLTNSVSSGTTSYQPLLCSRAVTRTFNFSCYILPVTTGVARRCSRRAFIFVKFFRSRTIGQGSCVLHTWHGLYPFYGKKLQSRFAGHTRSKFQVLRGTIVNRTFDAHKNLYVSLFFPRIFSPIYCCMVSGNTLFPKTGQNG